MKAETRIDETDLAGQVNDSPFFNTRKTKTQPVVQEIAAGFTNRHTMYHVGKGKNSLWYVYKEGIWKTYSNDGMLPLVRDYYVEIATQSKMPDTMQLLTATLLEQILRMVAVDVTLEAMPRMDADVIPCANGVVLKWDAETKSLTPVEMEKDFHVTHTLKVEYDSNGKCVLFDEKIREIIPDDDDRRVVQEYLGAALFTENRTRRILLLQGEGSSGKSVLVKIISGILGWKERAFDLDFSLLGKDFSLAGLSPDATLLSASETTSSALCGKGGAWAKKLVGGDEFQASQKYKNERVNHVGFYTLIMTSNEHVRLDFTSNGQEWRDRLLSIIFRHSIPIERQDRTLVERLLNEEGPGILNWLLEGAKRVRANNWIIKLTPEQEAVRDALIENGADSLAVFIKNCIVKDPTDEFTSAEAYKVYSYVCKDKGLEYYPDTVFYRRFAKAMTEKFKAVPVNSIDGSRGYRGYRLEVSHKE